MKASKILLAISIMILPAFSAFSADGTFDGEVGVTGLLSNVGGNMAKFNEYRDIRDGVFSGIRLKYDSDDFFLKGKASDIGYDTQNYHAEGGMYGKFKAYFDYNEIPHNFTYGARTFYDGAGGNNLTFSGPLGSLTNTATWKSFDYGLIRRTYGGGFSLDLLKPFFFDVSVSHEKKTGNYPVGVGQTSPGGPSLELPQPIDYTTNTLNVQAGYVKNPFYAAVSFMYQDFDNANTSLFFDNPSTGTQPNRDAFTLPPDNEYYKLAFKGSVQLPMNSKFNVNLATSRTTSDSTLFTSYVSSAVTNITLSNAVFNGKINTQNYNFVLTSNPVPFLVGKIYYKYYDRQNKSDQITTTDANFAGGVPFTNPLFDYTKNNFGIDLAWDLPAHFQLGTSYSWLKTDRDRGDIPETIDNTYSVDLKWKGLDFVTPKVGYEQLRRTADIGVLVKEYAGDQVTENAIAPFLRRFDAAPLNRDTFKASFDIFPLTNLSFGIGYKYKHDDYKDTILGLKSSKSNELNLDGSYAIGKIAQINAYYDMELSKDDQFQRAFTSAANANPSGPVQNSTNYNWDVKMKDNSYVWGVSTEVYIVPKKLTLILQHDNINSNGHADFTYLTAAALTGGRDNGNVDIGNWDDYRLTSYMARIRYTPTKKYTFTGGYAYEHYKYSDASFNNYTLVSGTFPPGNTNTALLTGAYANPNYQAHIVFFAVNYKF